MYIYSHALHCHLKSPALAVTQCVYSCCRRNMGGRLPPNHWKGDLNVSYSVGPGFTDNFRTQ